MKTLEKGSLVTMKRNEPWRNTQTGDLITDVPLYNEVYEINTVSRDIIGNYIITFKEFPYKQFLADDFELFEDVFDPQSFVQKILEEYPPFGVPGWGTSY